MRSIALYVFDGLGAFHLAAPFTIFGEDWTRLGLPAFELRLFSLKPGRTRGSAGVLYDAEAGLEALEAADLAIIPSWSPGAGPISPELRDALRAAHGRGVRIVGLCLGAYALAEAGLLDERAATTHWAYAEDFSRRFPKVRVDPLALYIDHGDVTTSAGVAAALDCCLHLLRRDHGAALASRLARHLVVPPFRQGGQAQYVEAPAPARLEANRFDRARDWALANLGGKLDLDRAAAEAGMSRRSFTRHFRRASGESFGAWLERQRLAEAQKRLEVSDAGIEAIAADCGFSGVLAMRQAFARSLGTTPARYRREFRGGDRAGCDNGALPS
jgi:transcriptional regulator GlxA family with amidase domain